MRKIIAFIIAAVAIGSYGQGPWAKKDWKQWSKDDCKKILEDSPWATRWRQSNAKMAEFATRNRDFGNEGVAAESELAVFYVVQLRSALPIREAFVRQLLIANGYDKLELPKQKEMERQTEGFLSRKYDDVIVVHVIYGSNVQEYNRTLATFWQTSFPEGTVPQQAFLNGPGGRKIAPIRMMSPKGGAQEFELIFPRIVEGKPLLQPGDKTISVEFLAPGLPNRDVATGRDLAQRDTATGEGQVASARVFAEFKVDRMMLNGQLVY